jgi:diadenosine tetraphosphate (Ap4A) HIT family hydrolase
MSTCWSCESNAGVRRISPGPPVYEGTHWLVEHAYPTALLGWLVIVLRRHAAALHELSTDEFHELARIQAMVIPLLATTLQTEKEYVACYAEAEHFQHVHFHVVPVTSDMPATVRGARSFSLLMVSEADALDPTRVRSFCESLRARLAE